MWNDDIVSDNAIAVHVRHIREKIEINPKEPRYLKGSMGCRLQDRKERVSMNIKGILRSTVVKLIAFAGIVGCFAGALFLVENTITDFAAEWP